MSIESDGFFNMFERNASICMDIGAKSNEENSKKSPEEQKKENKKNEDKS